MCIGSRGGGDNGAAATRAAEEARQARIADGMKRIGDVFSQFNDEYFGKRSQAYLDYATPQLDDQYTDAKKQVVYALDRKGQLNSSTGAETFAKLQKQYDTEGLAIKSRASDLATQARGDVERNRADVVAQLQGTADPTAAANAALARAGLLTAQPSFSPIANVFANLTALAAQTRLADEARNGTGGTRLFQSGASRASSGRVVGG